MRTPLTLRVSEPLLDRLKRYKARDLGSLPEAVRTLIMRGISEPSGAPTWIPEEASSEERERLASYPHDQVIGLQVSDEVLERLNLFCAWIAKNNFSAIKPTKSVAVRTLISEGLTSEGVPKWEDA